MCLVSYIGITMYIQNESCYLAHPHHTDVKTENWAQIKVANWKYEWMLRSKKKKLIILVYSKASIKIHVHTIKGIPNVQHISHTYIESIQILFKKILCFISFDRQKWLANIIIIVFFSTISLYIHIWELFISLLLIFLLNKTAKTAKTAKIFYWMREISHW